MEELIEQLTEKVNGCGMNTKAERMLRGAYVDALVMAKEALNIHLVMLSEIETESDKIANIIDNGISGHSLGESQGFVSGVEFVLNEIKERTHSA